MGNQCVYDEIDEKSLQEIGEKGGMEENITSLLFSLLSPFLLFPFLPPVSLPTFLP
jgi:hypothetical protein